MYFVLHKIVNHLMKQVCFTGEWRPLDYRFHISVPIIERRPNYLLPLLLTPFIVQLFISIYKERVNSTKCEHRFCRNLKLNEPHSKINPIKSLVIGIWYMSRKMVNTHYYVPWNHVNYEFSESIPYNPNSEFNNQAPADSDE